MLNVYCWRCGTRVSADQVLGIGHFDQDIGRYRGKGFIAFNCPKCQKARYQIVDASLIQSHELGLNKTPTKRIDLNQVIDFYQLMKDVNTVGNFLEKCELEAKTVSTEMRKPIVQPLDVYNLFSELNNDNMKRLLILTLDGNNIPLSWEFLGEGVSRPISFEPKVIFRTPFLLEEKVAVIIAHNLAEDFRQPTQRDILLTRRLIKAGKILGIDFLDHIIIEEKGFHSFDQLNYI